MFLNMNLIIYVSFLKIVFIFEMINCYGKFIRNWYLLCVWDGMILIYLYMYVDNGYEWYDVNRI